LAERRHVTAASGGVAAATVAAAARSLQQTAGTCGGAELSHRYSSTYLRRETCSGRSHRCGHSVITQAEGAVLGFWSGDEIRLKALRWKRSGWLVTVELPEGGSEDKKRKHTVEFQKSLIQFLIATVPAIVLYFIGWAYLYFYFSSFGINIAEIHLDTSTVFIYAFSPLAIVVKAYWPWIAPLTVIIVAVVLIITTLMPRKSRNEIKQIYRWVRDKVPIGVTTLLMIIGLLIFLSALVPVVKWAAIQQRKQVWASERPVLWLFWSKAPNRKRKQTQRRFVKAICNVVISRPSYRYFLMTRPTICCARVSKIAMWVMCSKFDVSSVFHRYASFQREAKNEQT
jgi:hypothetical protein